jgi:hypothetical protein
MINYLYKKLVQELSYFLIFTNFLLVPKVMDIFFLHKFTIFSEFCQEIEKIGSTKNDEKLKFTIKNVFLSLKNLSNYFLSNINQVGIANSIQKNHLNMKK